MRLSWDDVTFRKYEAGVDRGVFYPQNGDGVAWSGLLSVSESEDNAGANIIYVDGQKIINQVDLGSFTASIEALTYPDEFEPYDGYSEPMFSGQFRPLFNFSYRTLIGVANSIFSNEDIGLDSGYKLHLVYNCLVKPTTRDNKSIESSGDISSFTWDLSTTPIALPFDRPTSHFVIESPNVEQGALDAIENILYGSMGTSPRFPAIEEILAIFESNAIITIVDNGDGSFTATGPDENVLQTGDPTEWQFSWPTVFQTASDTYRVSSY